MGEVARGAGVFCERISTLVCIFEINLDVWMGEEGRVCGMV